jgi:hypothetical protein
MGGDMNPVQVQRGSFAWGKLKFSSWPQEISKKKVPAGGAKHLDKNYSPYAVAEHAVGPDSDAELQASANGGFRPAQSALSHRQMDLRPGHTLRIIKLSALQRHKIQPFQTTLTGLGGLCPPALSQASGLWIRTEHNKMLPSVPP